MCKNSGKAPDHLFLHCDVARELWIMVFEKFGVEWAMPNGWWTFWWVGMGRWLAGMTT
jgi:hypothetical protein